MSRRDNPEDRTCGVCGRPETHEHERGCPHRKTKPYFDRWGHVVYDNDGEHPPDLPEDMIDAIENQRAEALEQ